ncbi:MAG: EamA family transporter [Telmatospirillum sp.]|nr:EamA family transporter [Telmatospirillum sp.]
MAEIWGVAAAVASSALGGTSVGATRFLAGVIDPLAIGSFRFGLGVLLLLPIALVRRERWPTRGDMAGVIGLGLLFFFLFPLLFNASLIYTTAARGSLALSALPFLTMLTGAVLGRESLTTLKTAGVIVATAGVALALLSGQQTAPAGAWRGDMLMLAAALCMALYSVWSKPFIRRSAPLTFTVMTMVTGASCLVATSLWHDSFGPIAGFNAPQWGATLYLGIVGGALTFFLWALALAHTTPTRVAVSVTVNPIAASLVGTALLGEPLRWNVLLGVATILIGLRIVTMEAGRFEETRRKAD